MSRLNYEFINIPLEKEEKDLGITVEKKILKFNKHLLSVVNRCNKLTGLTKKEFQYLNKD